MSGEKTIFISNFFNIDYIENMSLLGQNLGLKTGEKTGKKEAWKFVKNAIPTLKIQLNIRT